MPLETKTRSKPRAVGALPPEAPGFNTDPATVLAVMYHYVFGAEQCLLTPGEPIGGLSAIEFERQLDELCRNLEPLSWGMLVSARRNGTPLPPRSFLLTFDDGLRCHASVVAPILARRRLRGVFFVPGRCLDEEHLLPAHALHILLWRVGECVLLAELDDYLKRHGGANEQLEQVDHTIVERVYHYETPDRATLKYMLNVHLPLPVRNALIATLFNKHIGSPARWAREWYLGWEELEELQAAGHTIGGHGYSHEPLATLTPHEQREDVYRCAQTLREGLGHDARPFTYPFGSFDDDAIHACRSAGFINAFTTERRWLTIHDGAFSLPRIDTIDVQNELQKDPQPCQPPSPQPA